MARRATGGCSASVQPLAVAHATDKKAAAIKKSAVLADKGVKYSDRERMKTWIGEKKNLEQTLKARASKAAYLKTLADDGYTITSNNTDTADHVEYEVLKGDQSYEVQIELHKKTSMGSKVDVDRNMWRADATKEAMRSGKAVMATSLMIAPKTRPGPTRRRKSRRAWYSARTSPDTPAN